MNAIEVPHRWAFSVQSHSKYFHLNARYYRLVKKQAVSQLYVNNLH